MALKHKLLAALYGSALIVPTACGDNDSSTRNNDDGWVLGENNTPGNNVTANNNPLACGADMLDELPYPGWQDAYAAGEITDGVFLLCAAEGEQCATLDEQTTNEFVYKVFQNNCDLEAWYAGGDVCGPVQLDDGRCCYAIPLTFGYCVQGRPFTVEGEKRTGGLGEAEGWRGAFDDDVEGLPVGLRRQVAQAWADAGEHEHASIASFSRFLLDLMALGAPRRLVEGTTRAIDDEVRHAAACFAVASAYAGERLGPGPIDIRGAEQTGDAEVALLGAIREGCIGETMAGVVAEWQAPRVASTSMRQTLEAIAEEEGEHALLAWEFVRWLLRSRPDLIGTARRAFAEATVPPESPWASGADTTDATLVAHGVLSAALEDQLRRRAYHDVVLPCADALFDSVARGDAS